jgi:hypothetical protein
MYRAPISPGWDDFAGALSSGVVQGYDRFRQGRAQRAAMQQEQQRSAALMARQAETDRIAAEDRARRMALEDDELGVIPEELGYDSVPTVSQRRAGPLAAITGGAMPAPAGPMSAAPTGTAGALLADARGAIENTRPYMEQHLRPGVRRVGNLLVDPTQSRAFRNTQMTEDVRRQREQAEERDRFQQAYRAALAAGHDESAATRYGTQAALGLNIPSTPRQALTEKRAELELTDEFSRREEGRREARDARERAERRREEGTGGGLTVDRARDTAEGIAASFAYEILNWPGDHGGAAPTMSNGQPTRPLDYVRGRLRDWARTEGVRLTEGEIRAIAQEQLNDLQKRYIDSGVLRPDGSYRTEARPSAGASQRPNRTQGNRTTAQANGATAGQIPVGDGPLPRRDAQQARTYIMQSGMNMEQSVARLRQLGRSDAEIMQILPEANLAQFPR